MNSYPASSRLGNRLNAFRLNRGAPKPFVFPATCLLGHRVNAFRLNYLQPRLWINIGGAWTDGAHQDVVCESLSISDRLNDTPNTVIATVRGTKPIEGNTFVIALGSQNASPLFRGTILRVTRVWAADNPKHVLHNIEATDPTWLLNATLLSRRYQKQSATDIANELVTLYAPGFIAAVEPALPVIDEITFTNATVMDAFVQIANRIGGYAFCGYDNRVHLFANVDPGTTPRALMIDHPSLAHVQYVRDLTQIVTRAIVEGGGVNALAPVSPGSTILPVQSTSWYASGGGFVRSGPQRIRYSSLLVGGQGAYAGTGVTPTTALVLAAAVGASAVEVGPHTYAYTWVTPSGETLPSPLATLTTGIGAIPAPSPPPATAAKLNLASGLVLGQLYQYAFAWSYVDSDTDVTQVSPLSAPVIETCQAWTSTSGISTPTAAPTAVLSGGGAGVDSGVHGYAYTFVTANGETVPSPLGSVTTGPIPNPTGAPSIYLATTGNGSGQIPAIGYVPGNRARFAVAYGPKQLPAMSGEASSALGPPSADYVLRQQSPGYVENPIVTCPTTGNPAARNGWVYMSIEGGPWYWANNGMFVNTGFANVTCGGPRTEIPLQPPTPAGTVNISGIVAGPAAVTGRKLYRTAANQSQLKLVATLGDNTTTTWLGDAQPDSALGANAPMVDETQHAGGITFARYTGPWDPLAKRLLVFRMAPAVGPTGYYRVLALPVNVSWSAGTYFDLQSDAFILANPSFCGPTTQIGNILAARPMVSGIAPGPGVVTARKVYRTVVNGSQLKLLATLADNVSTTLPSYDNTADASLGANAPVVDTAGVVSSSKLVLAGSTSLLLTSTAPFSTTGGYAVAGTQVLRYTGKDATSLTGIPASGDGAIQNSISYGTPVTTAPQLMGIPAAGDGAILFPIKSGDPVNLVVIVDDVPAQQALATLLGGTSGVRESLLVDGRISLTEALARGLAFLTSHKSVLESVAYQSRDPLTRSGAMITVDLPPPTDVRGTFRAQDVQITTFNPRALVFPTYDTRASSDRFTFEDLLRQLANTQPPPPTGENR